MQVACPLDWQVVPEGVVMWQGTLRSHETRHLIGRRIKITSKNERLTACAKKSGNDLEKLLGLFGFVDIAIDGDKNNVANQKCDNSGPDGPAGWDFLDGVCLAVTPPCDGNPPDVPPLAVMGAFTGDPLGGVKAKTRNGPDTMCMMGCSTASFCRH